MKFGKVVLQVNMHTVGSYQ